MTEPDEVLRRRDRPRHVGRDDPGELAAERITLVGHDEREPALLERSELVARLARQHEDGTVDLALEQAVHEGRFAIVVMEGGAEHRHEAELVERIRDAGDDRRKVVAEHHRDRDTDQSREAGPLRQPARAGLKLSARATSRTVSRVSGATSGRSLRTRDTVAIDTPARPAMSRIVARGLAYARGAHSLCVAHLLVSVTGLLPERRRAQFPSHAKPWRPGSCRATCIASDVLSLSR